MDIDLDSGRLGIFVFGFSFWLVLERIWSARTSTKSFIKRLLLHGSLSALNTTLIRIVAYVPVLTWIVYVEQMGWGVARWIGLEGWSELLLSIVVLDGFDYFWHRANHRIKFLWRFHKAHHSDNDMDVLTALRFHPGELVISSVVKSIWVVIWGPSAIAWFMFETLVSFCSQMHHSNLALPDRVERRLAFLLVTPKFHAYHHLVDRSYGDRNFSTIFSGWDRLFGTETKHLSMQELGNKPLGLPQGRARTLSPIQLILEPIKSDNLNLSNKTLT